MSLQMVSLNVGLCPEILTEALLNLFVDELKIKTVKDFLGIEPQKLVDVAAEAANGGRQSFTLSGRPLTLQDILLVRQKIFAKFSVFVTNLGEGLGSLNETTPITTGISDLVCYYLMLVYKYE